MRRTPSPARSRRVPQPAARFDSPAQAAYLHLWRAYDRLKAVEDELFARYELSAQQYNALRLLKAHAAPLTTSEIGSRLISRAPDVTRLLDRLEERGLVRRERRPENRRVVMASLAPAGKKLLAELAAPVRACHQRQLGHLDVADLAELVRLLQAAGRPHETESSPWRGEPAPPAVGAAPAASGRKVVSSVYSAR